MKSIFNVLKIKARTSLKRFLHVEVLEERVAADYLKIEKLENEIFDLEAKTERLQAELDECAGKLSRLDDSFYNLDDNLCRLDGRIDDLEEEGYTIENRFDNCVSYDDLDDLPRHEDIPTFNGIREVIHEELDNLPKSDIANVISTEDQLSVERLVTGIVRSEIATYNQYLLECTKVMGDHLESKSFD